MKNYTLIILYYSIIYLQAIINIYLLNIKSGKVSPYLMKSLFETIQR